MWLIVAALTMDVADNAAVMIDVAVMIDAVDNAAVMTDVVDNRAGDDRCGW